MRAAGTECANGKAPWRSGAPVNRKEPPREGKSCAARARCGAHFRGGRRGRAAGMDCRAGSCPAAHSLFAGILRCRPILRLYAIIGPSAAAAFLLLYFLYPRALAPYAFLRSRWRPLYSYAALAAAGAAFFAFIVRFGNRQFGGYDFSILIDTGCAWLPARRLIGISFVRRRLDSISGVNTRSVFGLRWDAQLYAASLYASASFLGFSTFRRVAGNAGRGLPDGPGD